MSLFTIIADESIARAKEILPSFRRRATSFCSSWSGSAGGTFRPEWWQPDIEIPGNALQLYEAPDAFYAPALGLIVTDDGRLSKASYTQASYADPKLTALERIWENRAQAPLLEEAVLSFPAAGLTNYGHFLLDGLTSVAIIKTLQLANTFVTPPLHSWQRQHFATINIAPIELPQPLYRVRRALYTSAFGQNLHNPNVHFQRLAKMQRVAICSKNSNCIYVSRKGHKRTFLSEAVLIEKLSRRGVTIVQPEMLSVREQIATFAGADIIIAPTGAGLANVLYARPGSVIFEIIPRDMTLNLHSHKWVAYLAAMAGADWRPFFCENTGTESDMPTHGHVKRAGFRPFDLEISTLLEYLNLPNFNTRKSGLAPNVASNNSKGLTMSGSTNSTPSFREEYLKVLLEALKHPYVSTSSKDNIRTGHGYQSVDLQGLVAIGARPSRKLFIEHLNVSGKSVLDIGANFGEISRLARKYGAALVDGYEYDPFFVEVARMINAVNGVTRVSMFQGDATDPNMYSGMKYDAVIAFSVFVYIEKILAEISNITDCMVFETHTLDHGIDFYLTRIVPFFPFFKLLGFTEMAPDTRKSRALLVFGKSQNDVASILALRTLKPKNYVNHAFFQTHGDAKRGLPNFLSSLIDKIVAPSGDLNLTGFNQQYLESFCLGYNEYLQSGRLSMENIYARNLKAAIERGYIDPALKPLLNSPEHFLTKVNLRFQDFRNAHDGHWHLIPPVKVRVRNEGNLIFESVDGSEIRGESLDGHHRFFLHQLFAQPSIEAMIEVPEPLAASTRMTEYRLT